jgi:hypothetical protein
MSLTHTERQQISSAEAVSLQEPELLDCNVCAEQGYPHRHECDTNCPYYEKWVDDDECGA